MNISEYLLTRLESLGTGHIFGIPGDFILPFFQSLDKSELKHIATCNELNAGYAADGYARLKGLGVAAVTYGPGAFSIVNAVAGAYAEGVPLMVISGGPDTRAYASQPILHHTLPGRYDASIKIFAQITGYCAVLTDPRQATAQIDEALRICLSENTPVYLEIPRDIQTHLCDDAGEFQFYSPSVKGASLAAAIDTILARVQKGGRTVIIPGHEVQRQGLENKILALLDKTGFHAASMFIGKADFLEQHPQCIGAYQGAGSLQEVSEYVEAADTILFLGVVLSDFNLGGFTANLSTEQVVNALDGRLLSSTDNYEDVCLADLVEGLLKALPEGDTDNSAPRQLFSHKPDMPYKPDADAAMSNKRFYDRMAHFIQPGDIVAADAGCAINATHLQLPQGAIYLAACYWASIGMGFGAAFGACFAAKPGQRIIALEGDGSFQMTAQELSSMARYNCPAIVFVVNNKGYTAERLIHDGAFNDIADWHYHQLPAAFGGTGIDVHTEGDLELALAQAETHTGPGPLIIEVHVDPLDASEAFTLMSETLRSQ